MKGEGGVVRFASRYSSYRVVMEPPRAIRDPSGAQVGIDHGRTLQFVDHAYETSDPEEIAYLGQLLGSEVRIVTPGAEGPPAGVEVADTLTTASALGKRVLRCETCGRAGFRNPQALKMHQRSHKQSAASAEAVAASP